MRDPHATNSEIWQAAYEKELDHAFAYVLGGLTLYNPGCGGGNMHACHWGKPAPKTAACRMQHALFWQTGRSDVGVARVMF